VGRRNYDNLGEFSGQTPRVALPYSAKSVHGGFTRNEKNGRRWA